ncbi:MAG TPA: CGNR zinc finger domain-containing protein [Gemmatimonadaceae bacterium]|nr:CGNR zinc finger domain-containing protein [Gemmatimonadaceae bacterium]
MNMEPVFLGDHPAIDFLNTAFAPRGEPVDVITDGRSLLDWLVHAGLVTESAAARLKRRVSTERLDAAASAARDMRTWAKAWITRWRRDPEADYSAELRRLNAWLQRGATSREVVDEHGRLHLAERVRLDSADDLLAVVATSLAELVTGEDPTYIKSCAGSDCTLWFLDRTKGHRRLFCSASACGNRAKVAAFRARHAGP